MSKESNEEVLSCDVDIQTGTDKETSEANTISDLLDGWACTS